MKLNSKLTWGLAWAGLALVVAVPSADVLTGRTQSAQTFLTSDTDAVKTAAIPAAAPAPTTTLTDKGIIITPGGTAAPPVTVAAPATISAASPAPVTETRVAEIPPIPTPLVAPEPYPASLRPHEAAPAMGDAPLVSDPPVADAAPAPAETDDMLIPPEDIPVGGWSDGALAAYLRDRGLLEPYSPDDTQSTASVTDVDQPDSDYDPDGFYLSDGPNEVQLHARTRRLNDEDRSFNLF